MVLSTIKNFPININMDSECFQQNFGQYFRTRILFSSNIEKVLTTITFPNQFLPAFTSFFPVAAASSKLRRNEDNKRRLRECFLAESGIKYFQNNKLQWVCSWNVFSLNTSYCFSNCVSINALEGEWQTLWNVRWFWYFWCHGWKKYFFSNNYNTVSAHWRYFKTLRYFTVASEGNNISKNMLYFSRNPQFWTINRALFDKANSTKNTEQKLL